MKLWIVTLKGMNVGVLGAPYGKACVIAKDPKEASEKLIKYMVDNNIGNDSDRVLESVELIADSDKHTNCSLRLFI